jgi:hypothetical protein
MYFTIEREKNLCIDITRTLNVVDTMGGLDGAADFSGALAERLWEGQG